MRNNRLVYIIDDDLIQNEVHLLTLEKTVPNVKVEVFTSGKDALSVINKKPIPDILFLDLHMPGEDTHGFLKQVQHLEIDIYLMSSLAYLEDQSIFSLYPNVRDFISKPLLAHKLKPLFTLAEKLN